VPFVQHCLRSTVTDVFACTRAYLHPSVTDDESRTAAVHFIRESAAASAVHAAADARTWASAEQQLARASSAAYAICAAAAVQHAVRAAAAAVQHAVRAAAASAHHAVHAAARNKRKLLAAAGCVCIARQHRRLCEHPSNCPRAFFSVQNPKAYERELCQAKMNRQSTTLRRELRVVEDADELL
jgi:hypothetical protein